MFYISLCPAVWRRNAVNEWQNSQKVSELRIILYWIRRSGSWFMGCIVDKHIELIMVIGNNDSNQTLICYN